MRVPGVFGRLVVVLVLFGVLAEPALSKVAQEVTIDVSSAGAGTAVDSRLFRSSGLLLPESQCVPDCSGWQITGVQSDDALVQPPGGAAIEGRFVRPASQVSLLVAPRLQGTARYTLRVFGGDGRALAEQSLTVTQDFGDPANTGFGYFSLGVSGLARPAHSFRLENVFVRSSFPGNTEIPFGVSSISFTHFPGAR